jgi:uridine kinase
VNEPLEIHPSALRAASALCDVLAIPQGGRYVLAVGGESGSGKSTTALALKAELEDRGRRCAVLHMDGYFKLPPRENHEARLRSLEWVGLQEVRLDVLQEHLDAFRGGASRILVPEVDYLANEISVRELDLNGIEVLLVEGTYVLYLNGFDAGVFMPATYQQTRAARMKRVREAYDPYVERVLHLEHTLVRASAPRASWAVHPDFRVEALTAPLSQ